MNFSKNKLKRKNDYEGLMENMSIDFPSTLEGFRYKFNEDGHMHHIDTGEKFTFQISQDHSHNQKHYEALGEVITEHVYELLESQDVGLNKLEIPLKEKEKNAKGFIFVSENYEIAERLLVLVHGSGVVRAGQWARRLIINDCLDHGTQIPYIKQGIEKNYGIVVLNTNQHQGYVKGKKKDIQVSETPERHFSYVWKNIIEKAKAEKIFVVAHSYGGFLVVDYLMKNEYVIEKVVAVAFTDSVHSLSYQTSGYVQEWFEKNSVNWVTSFEDLDTPLVGKRQRQFNLRVSAGTTIHEETSWKAMGSIFSYFASLEMELGSKPYDGKEQNRNRHAKSSNNVEGVNESSSQNKPKLLDLASQYNSSNKGASALNHVGTDDSTISQGGTNSDIIDKCSQVGTIDSEGSVSAIGADKNVNDDKSSDGHGETDGDNIGDDSQVGTSVGGGASACSTSGTDNNKSNENKHKKIDTNGEHSGSQSDTSHNDSGERFTSLNQAKADVKISDDNPDGTEETSGKMGNDHNIICARNEGDINGEMKEEEDDGHTSTGSHGAGRNDSKYGANTGFFGECIGQTDEKTATHEEEKSESKTPPEHENIQVETEDTVTLISQNYVKNKL